MAMSKASPAQQTTPVLYDLIYLMQCPISNLFSPESHCTLANLAISACHILALHCMQLWGWSNPESVPINLPSSACPQDLTNKIGQVGRTSEAEGKGEGIKHIQEELVILPQEIPYRLL